MLPAWMARIFAESCEDQLLQRSVETFLERRLNFAFEADRVGIIRARRRNRPESRGAACTERRKSSAAALENAGGGVFIVCR